MTTSNDHLSKINNSIISYQFQRFDNENSNYFIHADVSSNFDLMATNICGDVREYCIF
jgi:hypothetical protein